MKKEYEAHIADDGRIQTVEEHCIDVSEYASEAAERQGLFYTLRLAGLIHDCGKDTDEFSDYLNKAKENPSSVHRGDINHSSAGGKYIMDFAETGKDQMTRLTAQMIAWACISHHGVSDILEVDGADRFGKRLNPEKDNFYEEAISNSKSFLNKDELRKLFEKSKEEISNYYNDICKIALKMNKNPKSEVLFLFGCLQRLILSYLVDADRRDTAEFADGMKRKYLTRKELNTLWQDYQAKLDAHLRTLRNDSHMGCLRNEMSEKCFSAAGNEDGIYRLSIPTGGGKTFASLRYAFEKAKQQDKRHIYYIAPFLSILEQNAGEIRDLLKDDEHVLEHHSNVVIEETDKESLKRYELYTDEWSSPVILTTMVQFLNVLFGSEMTAVRRMRQLTDSIIIIDEAQSVPVRSINLFNTMLNFLSGCCHTTILLCTATQPLFDRTPRKLLYGNPSDLIENQTDYTNEFKRVDIKDETIEGGYSTDALADFILAHFNENMLVILNTKSAVRTLYEEMKSRLKSSEILLVQLTTYMCAQHRLDIIDGLKSKLGKKKILCISTQLIEAGVDISFESVVRSITGLDSITQAAGRCNRGGERKIGEVYIVNYQEEHIGSLFDIKEGKRATEILLDKYQGDLLMPEAMDAYYEQFFFNVGKTMDYPVNDKTDMPSDETLYRLLSDNYDGAHGYELNGGKKYTYAMRQAYKTAWSMFQPIENNGTISLIVPYKDGEKIIEELKSAESIKEIRICLRRLQRFTVNLWKEDKVLKLIRERNAIDDSVLDGKVWILDKGYYNNDIGISGELQPLIH